jgi:sialic acid synthase SpsE
MTSTAEFLRPRGPLLIAEIGANHQGSGALAKQLIDLAIGAGVDVVKGQIRDVVTARSEGGSYDPSWERPYESPHSHGATYAAHRRALELDFAEHRSLRRYTAISGAQYGVSVWDRMSAERWLRAEQPSWIKIPSACLPDRDMLAVIAATDVVAVVSTGMATPGEIEAVVDLWRDVPERLAILHCVSAYPQQVEDVHLRQLERLVGLYSPIPIGISGHWVGIQIDVIAATMGARIIERHITMDRTMRGSDHAASLGPDGVRRWVRDVRAVEIARGWPRTGCYPCEAEARSKLRVAPCR